MRIGLKRRAHCDTRVAQTILALPELPHLIFACAENLLQLAHLLSLLSFPRGLALERFLRQTQKHSGAAATHSKEKQGAHD